MDFAHEKLDVYRAAIEYVGWAFHYCEGLKGHRNAKAQLLRASQAIPLNIAEGNGKVSGADRRRYFEIARGSALECSAVQDVLQVCRAMSVEENAKAKVLLDRIVAMLTKLGKRGYAVREMSVDYEVNSNDTDCDCDCEADSEADSHECNRMTGRLQKERCSRAGDSAALRSRR